LRLHGHDLRFLSAKSRAVFRCIACAAALTPPPAPPSQGGENLRRLVFFPPLRRGDTGGCFECLCAVPGSSSTRLKIALINGRWQMASRFSLATGRSFPSSLATCHSS